LKGIIMTYNPGAGRAFNYSEDHFVALDPLDRAPVVGTGEAWRGMLDLAANGNPLAKRIVQFGRAMNAEKLAASTHSDVPEWAADVLNELNDDHDDALAALAAL
jgi:hypothetical protein